MRSVTYRRCVVAFLAILASRVAVAQDSSDVWVAGIRAPQYFAVLVKVLVARITMCFTQPLPRDAFGI